VGIEMWSKLFYYGLRDEIIVTNCRMGKCGRCDVRKKTAGSEIIIIIIIIN
jgi:hypothetical protein